MSWHTSSFDKPRGLTPANQFTAFKIKCKFLYIEKFIRYCVHGRTQLVEFSKFIFEVESRRDREGGAVANRERCAAAKIRKYNVPHPSIHPSIQPSVCGPQWEPNIMGNQQTVIFNSHLCHQFSSFSLFQFRLAISDCRRHFTHPWPLGRSAHQRHLVFINK